MHNQPIPVYTNGKNHKPPADKLLPHNLEAEEAVLGSILIGNEDAMLMIAPVNLQPADFFIERHAFIFAAILSLYQDRKPLDYLSITIELERQGKIKEVGGVAEITRLYNSTPSYFNAAYYAEIVKNCSICRQVVDAAGKMARLAHDDLTPAADLLEESRALLLRISTANTTGGPIPLSALRGEFLDYLEALENCKNGIPGIPTGFYDLDKKTGGLQRGDLILIGGRPRMGKSALMGQIAYNAARQGKRVLIFSLEMSAGQINQRLISMESGIPLKALRTNQIPDERYKDLYRAMESLAALPVFIDDKSRYIDEIIAKAVTHHARSGVDLVMVDYAQRIRTRQRYQNRDAELGDISGPLKSLALQDLNVPVVLISSLSRACEARGDKRPMLSDLRESGNLEYDADVVGFVYRDDVYYPDTQYPNIAELIISKNRSGEEGMIELFFRKELVSFVSLEKRVIKLEQI
jgi:replicative DNA helicase